MAAASKETGSFDWSTSLSFFLLQRNPSSLVESRGDDKAQQNIVHVVATMAKKDPKACAGFLSQFVALDETASKSARTMALNACLLKDSEGRTPLHYAILSEDTSSINAILAGLGMAFDDAFCKLKNGNEHSQLVHPGDLFPLDEFKIVLELYPNIALAFIEKLKLADAYRNVADGCDKAPLDEGSEVVSGSSERSPIAFWKNQFVTLAAVEVDDEVRV